MRADCAQFPPGSRQYAICTGAADLPLTKINASRSKWGLTDITESDRAERVVMQQRIHAGNAKPPKRRAKQSGSCCGAKTKPWGPGTELIKIFNSKNVPTCQQCKKLARRMDAWGPQECRKKTDFLIEDILPRARAWLDANRPWVAKLLPNVIEDAGIRVTLRKHIGDAITAAEANRPARRKRKRNPKSNRVKRNYEPEPLVFTERRPMKWAVGFTVGQRDPSTIDESVASVVRAGWESPYIFAEPGVSLAADTGAYWRPTTIAPPLFENLGPKGQFGPHQNYVQTLVDLLEAEPDAEMILYAQDDGRFSAGCREVLESIHWPKHLGLLSLWCPSGMGYKKRGAGMCRVPTDNIIGAIAFAMPRATAEYLVQCPTMLNWCGSGGGQKGHKRRTLDMATGRALHAAEKLPYFLTHSLVDHFSESSTIGNGASVGFRKSYRFVGNDATCDDVRTVYGDRETFIVIPGHNCADLTLTCLAALIDSTARFRVCYVDNGSDAAALAAVRSGLTLLGGTHEVIENATNEGFTRAVQQGLDVAGDRDVLILNNDCRVSENTIEELQATLAANPTAAAVCPVTADKGLCSVRKAANDNLTVNGGTRPSPVLPWFCCLLRNEAIKQIGPLPTDSAVASGLGVDDWWGKRAVANGWELRITGATFAEHDHHATFKASGQDRLKLQDQAKRWLSDAR